MPTAISEPANAAMGTAEIPRKAMDTLKVIARTAPSAAPVETPSVNGVASGFRKSPWNTTPAEAKSAPTHAPACAQSRDEEDLRVDVVGERNREVEGTPQIDRGRTHERRQQQRDRGQRAESGDGADEAALQRHARSRSAVRRTGTTIR
jgi:hypothetical protein